LPEKYKGGKVLMTEKELQIQNRHSKITEIADRQARYQFEKLGYGKTPYEDQFIPIPHKLLDNPSFRNGFLRKNRSITYYWLRRFVIRGRREFYPDPLNLYQVYWLRGELASCLSIKRMAEDLKMPVSTIRSHINQLEAEGIIKVDRYEPDETLDGKKHEVYVLGNCLEGKESWFIDQIFAEKQFKRRA